MNTITRAEAFAAMERGEEVEILVQNGDPYRGEWVPAGYQSFAWDKYQAKFRLKPKPQRAKIVHLFLSNLNDWHFVTKLCPGAQTFREVLPGDMTGREMADVFLDWLNNSWPREKLIEIVKDKRDTLPETEE